MSITMFTSSVPSLRHFLQSIFEKNSSTVPFEKSTFDQLKEEHKELKKDYAELEDSCLNLLREQKMLQHKATIANLLSNMKLIQAICSEDYESAYGLIAGDLDPNGFHLYDAAKRQTKIDVCRAFPTEDNLGYFENANGFELLEWLETEAYGSCDWEQLNPPYERAVNRKINKDTPKYKEYRATIYKQTVTSLLNLQT